MKPPIPENQLRAGYIPTVTRTTFINSDKSERFWCRAITFVNRGDTPVYIDGYLLEEDEKLEIAQFGNDIDVTTYGFRFGTLVTTKNLEVKYSVPTVWPF